MVANSSSKGLTGCYFSVALKRKLLAVVTYKQTFCLFVCYNFAVADYFKVPGSLPLPTWPVVHRFRIWLDKLSYLSCSLYPTVMVVLVTLTDRRQTRCIFPLILHQRKTKHFLVAAKNSLKQSVQNYALYAQLLPVLTTKCMNHII